MMVTEPLTRTAVPAVPAAPASPRPASTSLTLRSAPASASPRPAPAAARSLRAALVSEGSYPFYPGGVSLWCQQLVQGMPENSFTAVALTVDGTERCAWEVPDNVTELVNLPLWGSRPRRRQLRGAPPATFTKRYKALLRTLLDPPAPEDEAAHADQFVAALRGLYEYAQKGDLSSAMTCNDSLDQLRRAWHDAGLDSGRRPDAVGPLTLRDAFVAADRIEHLLRPLSHPPMQADVCHLAMNGVSALVALSSKWAYGTPMVMSEHGVYLRERYLGLSDEDASKPVKIITMRFNRYLAAGAYRNADVLAPHSSYNRRWQLFGGADPARMRTMYNGINPDEFPVAQGEPEEPTIVFVGRIDPLKDLHTLIRAFAIVRDKIPNARLRIFGPVPPGNEQYQASCVQLAAELGLSGAAAFEGRIPRQTDAYQAGHLVALTSVSEGFPYTVVESMATGRPQVCTNVGGVSEAVGDAGFVVPPRDPEAVAAACIRLLEDPDLRRNFGLRARQRVMDRFTLDQWTNAYHEIYAELLAGGQPEATGTPGVPAPPAAQDTVGSGASTPMLPTGSRIARNPVRAADGPSPGAGMLSREDSQSRPADRPLVAPAGQTGRPGQARNVPRPAPRDPDVARQAGPVLVVTVQGSEIRLQPGQSCTVGRDPGSDIMVTDLRVSWRHAVVRSGPDGWILEDAGSTNGTFVDSGKVHSHLITSDCAVRLGQPEDGPLVRCSVIGPESRAASVPAPSTANVPALRTTSVPAPRTAAPNVDSRPADRPLAAPAGHPKRAGSTPGVSTAGADDDTVPRQAGPVLVITAQGSEIRLQVGQSCTVGRDPGSDIVVADLRVSWRHAVVRFAEDGWILEDAGSTNGTFVGSGKVDRHSITSDCAVRLGQPQDGPLVRCSVISPEPRTASVPEPRTASVPVPRTAIVPVPRTTIVPVPRHAVANADRGTVTFYQPVHGLWIGRATDNDLVVDDLAASRYHAIMQNSGDGKYEIIDLDSHNGTFVNGQPVSSAVITERDTIGIGRAAFRLVGDKLREFGNREGETADSRAHENSQPAPEPVTEPVKKEPVAAPVKNWWEAL
jgi:polysaccharide biosynthesis protein PelF